MLELRPAEPADALAVAGVHVRSWQVGYRHLMPDEYLDGLRIEDRAATYTFGWDDPDVPLTIVALADGATTSAAVWGIEVRELRYRRRRIVHEERVLASLID